MRNGLFFFRLSKMTTLLMTYYCCICTKYYSSYVSMYCLYLCTYDVCGYIIVLLHCTVFPCVHMNIIYICIAVRAALELVSGHNHC